MLKATASTRPDIKEQHTAWALTHLLWLSSAARYEQMTPLFQLCWMYLARAEFRGHEPLCQEGGFVRGRLDVWWRDMTTRLDRRYNEDESVVQFE